MFQANSIEPPFTAISSSMPLPSWDHAIICRRYSEYPKASKPQEEPSYSPSLANVPWASHMTLLRERYGERLNDIGIDDSIEVDC